MLHTVNKSPHANGALESCRRFLQAGDVVVLLEDGVYAAATGTTKSAVVEEMLGQHKVYAMQADLQARGIDELINGVETVDYDGFVALIEAHKVQAWL